MGLSAIETLQQMKPRIASYVFDFQDCKSGVLKEISFQYKREGSNSTH